MISPKAFTSYKVTPTGNGSYVVTPDKPVFRYTVAQAAVVLGCNKSTVKRLISDGVIKGIRPTPGKIWIDSEVLQTHLQAVQDPDYWQNVRKSKNK